MDDDHRRMEKILFLQRIIRSFYVRRQFEHVRQEYLRTLRDIEGEIAIKPPENIPTKSESIQQTGRRKSNERFHCNLWNILVAIVPTRDELLRKREELAIELLWIEQAIQSRKDYLRLKSRYTTSVS